MRAALKVELEQSTSEVIFDLSNTVVVDSAGIGLLIATYNWLNRLQGGEVSLIEVPSDIVKMLQSMRLTSRFHVVGRTF